MAQLRVVSLVPSLTELVFAFGAGETLVGRTRFCTEPKEQVGAVPIVGGTKNPKVERIIALEPDLVIANKEENRKEDVEALRAAGLSVLLTDPNTVAGASETIAEVGRLLGSEPAATSLNAEIVAALAEPLPTPALRVFAAVWWEPLMGLGSASYGHDLLQRAGAVNVLAARPRYPEVTIDELAALQPDLILLPDEPYPFRESHAADFARIAPARGIDGKLLWWYGPRIPDAVRSLRTILADATPG